MAVEFLDLPYDFTVDENSAVDTEVDIVVASSDLGSSLVTLVDVPDTNNNGIPSFYIEQGTGGDGEVPILVRDPEELDREENPTFEFIAKATETDVSDPDIVEATVTVTLNNIDELPVAIDDSFTTDEDTPIPINFLANDIDSDPEGNNSVFVSAIDDSGTLGEVILENDGSYTYDPNGAFDNLNEGEIDTDAFTYEISTVFDGIQSVIGTAIVTINVEAVPDPTVEVQVEPNPVEEGGTATVTVTTTDIADGETVDYELSGEDIEAADFGVDLTGTIEINNNTGSLDIPIEEDDLPEGEEIFNTAIFFPGGEPGVDQPIEDNVETVIVEKPTVEVQVEPNPVEEGGSATVTVTTTNIADGELVDYELSGEGIEAEDFGVDLTGTIEINDNTGSLDIPIEEDDLPEGEEIFNTAIFFPGGEPGVDQPIEDNVETVIVEKPTVEVQVEPNPVEEGGSATVTVTTTNIADGELVDYELSGEGIEAEDFGVDLTGTIEINDNTGSLDIPIEEDDLPEGEEIFNTAIFFAGGEPGVDQPIEDNVETVIVEKPTVEVQVEPNPVEEGGSATVTVTTTNIADGELVDYELSGEGIEAADFGVDLTGTIEINDNTGSLDIPIEEDDLPEGEEIFNTTISFSFLEGAEDAIDETETVIIDGNLPPVAVDDEVSTDEETLLNGDVFAENPDEEDSDPDGDDDDLIVTAVNENESDVERQIDLDSGALLTLNEDGTFDYDPNGEFDFLAVGETAIDSFTYTISDGNETDTAQVTVSIEGVNDSPEIENPLPDLEVEEDETITPIPLVDFFEDVETPDSELTFEETSSDQELVTTSVDPNTGELTLTLEENANGDAEITVVAIDSSEASVQQTFQVEVEPVNDPPEIENPLPDLEVEEDETITPIPLVDFFEDVETPDSELTFTATSSDQELVTTSVDPNTGELTLTLEENANGDAEITVVAIDSSEASVQQTFQVEVEPVNDPPEVRNDTNRTNEDTPLTVTIENSILNNDFDLESGQPSEVSAVEGNADNVGTPISLGGGSLTVNLDGSYEFDPNGAFDDLALGERQPVTFTYRASDGELESEPATVSIIIQGTNDAPEVEEQTPVPANDEQAPALADANLDLDPTTSQLATVTELFDEEFYLNNNPDVAEAVDTGLFETGVEHFLEFGIEEERAPSLILSLFTEDSYLENNPDVEDAVIAGDFVNGLDHFLIFGMNEGRNGTGYEFFEAQEYLNVNPDVATAVDNGQLSSALEHFIYFGFGENRSGVDIQVEELDLV
ncbi:outer membrane adhesin like protein [Halothece sp. PCC 7418]|uniref:Ig-like domain-containing protein n=1 Tax=Halothece sp. (strain PCC 7418) TaxID=65093 RepID=UPI0002A05E6A|nr:Ig-like domain-containing protein [Halothece sp. PCC 7418]AFZ45543.1 outer membrane adhesin like protein [Halothece sp. PCC 7418]